MAKKDHVTRNPNPGTAPVTATNHSEVQEQQQNIFGEEYFPLGTMVKIVKANSLRVEGEVMAFDPLKKILMLKRGATSKKPGVLDIHVINMDMVKDVDIVSEPIEVKPVPKSAEVANAEAKITAAIMKRKKFAKAFKQGISLQGINVYRAISKTLEEITWKDSNIVVMDKVTISPPYKPENVKGNAETAVAHVRKIVEKYHEEVMVWLAANTYQVLLKV